MGEILTRPAAEPAAANAAHAICSHCRRRARCPIDDRLILLGRHEAGFSCGDRLEAYLELAQAADACARDCPAWPPLHAGLQTAAILAAASAGAGE